MPGHRLGEHGVEHDLGQRPQPPDDGRYPGDVLAVLPAVPQVSGDHVARHRGGHVVRDGVHLGSEPFGQVEDVRQRHARRHQFGARAQQPGAGHQVTRAVRLENAEIRGLGPVLRRVPGTEQRPQLLGRDVAGDLVGPRVRDGRLKVENLGQGAAALPDGQHLADVGERVPAAEQPADEPEAGQVGVRVDAHAPVAAGRGEQSSILVDANVADGGRRQPCQLVDAVLAHAGKRYHLYCDNVHCNVRPGRAHQQRNAAGR
jgi:hypothetical protein